MGAAEHVRLAPGLGARVARLEGVTSVTSQAVRDEPVGEGRTEDPAPDDERGRHGFY